MDRRDDAEQGEEVRAAEGGCGACTGGWAPLPAKTRSPVSADCPGNRRVVIPTDIKEKIVHMGCPGLLWIRLVCATPASVSSILSRASSSPQESAAGVRLGARRYTTMRCTVSITRPAAESSAPRNLSDPARGEKGRMKEERRRTSRQPGPEEPDQPQFYDAPRDRTKMDKGTLPEDGALDVEWRLARRAEPTRSGGGWRGRGCGRLGRDV